jgi:glucan phosphoethanolaminetransferase (alkaline phosphatase superfamily)
MDGARIHVLINELPAIGVGFGTLLLLIAAIVGGDGLRKLAFGLFVGSAVIQIVVYFSGVPAAITNQYVPGVTTVALGQHHSAALLTLIAVELLGVLGTVAILSFKKKKALSRTFLRIALLCSLATAAACGWTVYLGKDIRNAIVREQYQPHDRPDAKPHWEKSEEPSKPNIVP